MFILACLFVLGKVIKLVRLTPETGDMQGGADKGKSGEITYTYTQLYINFTYNTHSLITAVALKPCIYKTSQDLEKQPCFKLACNFEIIQ